MTDKTEMVLVSRDELQQLIGASVRCAFEEYRQEQAPQDTSEYYTIRQLAEKWGVSIATIWRHEKLGHIKGQRIGRRVLFPKEQIDRSMSFYKLDRLFGSRIAEGMEWQPRVPDNGFDGRT